MFKIILIFVLFSKISEQHFIEYEYREIPLRPHPPFSPNPIPPSQQEISPSLIMVDLTNDLAYRVLHHHSILNRNNFAYSPSALMSVLLALYEGSAGRSSLELRNALLLPTNRDIIRIGYRDIHRRLRTYFFDQENPLVGLSLNKENVTITPEYESLLHFYGYDLGIDMISSTIAPPLTTPDNEIPPDNLMSRPLPPTVSMTTTTEKFTTTEPPLTTTTMPPTTTITEIQSTTVETTTETPTEATTTIINTTEAPEPSTTTIEDETTEIASTTPTIDGNTEETTKFDAEETTEPTTDMFLRLVQPNTFSTNAKIISLPSGQEYLPPAPKKSSMSRSSRPLISRMQNRDKRHLFGLNGLKGLDTSIYFNLFNHHHLPPQPFGPQQESIQGHATHADLTDDDVDAAILAQQVDLTPHFDFFNQHSAPAAIHFDVDHNFATTKGVNHQVINHVFYLNTREIIQSTYKVYNSVLYYKYIEELKMTVLELELDSVEYNLMIMLPDFNVDLLAATASLKFGPTLRALRRQLKPRWVQAIIPDFKLHGKMFLTSDLQNMGINDVFEPTRADFRPMTEESGIYVKHIEQSIDVNIRTRPINQIKRNVGPQPRPIQVSVNHPFLFFIIDRDFDIATMAGRVLNPLNVRIQ